VEKINNQSERQTVWFEIGSILEVLGSTLMSPYNFEYNRFFLERQSYEYKIFPHFIYFSIIFLSLLLETPAERRPFMALFGKK
jgi:hypothetical protein